MTKKTKMLLGILAAVVVIAGAGLFSAQSGLFKGMIFSKNNLATQKMTTSSKVTVDQKTTINPNVKLQKPCMEVGATLVGPADSMTPSKDLKAVKFRWVKAPRAEYYEFWLKRYPNTDGKRTKEVIIRDPHPEIDNVMSVFFTREDFDNITGVYEWGVTAGDTDCGIQHGGTESRRINIESFADLN